MATTGPMRVAARGFTLIELMVVMAILAVLFGMAMPIIAISRRYAQRTATDALLRKVDTALRLFKTDTHVYPWDGFLQPRLNPDGTANPQFNSAYPDLTTAQPSWSNRLFRQLGTAPTAAERDAVQADAETARNVFNYDLTNADGKITSGRQEVTARYNRLAFLTTDSLPYKFTYTAGAWQPTSNNATAAATVLNRMAQERYALAMLAGATTITGPALATVTSPSGATYASTNPNNAARTATRVVPAPASAGNPGWADAYLAGELEKRFVKGDTIVDIWGRPLVYVCQVLPGCEAAGLSNPFNATAVSYIDETVYGLGPRGRRPLVPYDAYNQRTLAVDGTFLPDPANLIRSDIRAYAAAPYAYEFELWSAGADGRFAWMRDERDNDDNLGARPYLTGLR